MTIEEKRQMIYLTRRGLEALNEQLKLDGAHNLSDTNKALVLIAIAEALLREANL